MKRIFTTATIALLAASLAACGGSDDSSSSSSNSFGEGEVAELRALLTSFGAPADETLCVAEALAGNVDQGELEKMLDAAESGNADADIDLDTALLFNDAVTECGLG